MIYRNGGKRVLDAIAAALLLFVFSPILLVLGIVSAIKFGRPVLFRQVRPGLDGRLFTLIKFRSMTDQRDRNGDLLPDELRLRDFGKFLRSTSLDEIPQLWNVLRGEMSLIGPRPLLPHYIDRYTERQARRMEVRPGITGWAQVNGRNAVDWESRFELDVWYVENLSLYTDLKILFLTIKAVFKREGISGESVGTMEEFKGQQDSSEQETETS